MRGSFGLGLAGHGNEENGDVVALLEASRRAFGSCTLVELVRTQKAQAGVLQVRPRVALLPYAEHNVANSTLLYYGSAHYALGRGAATGGLGAGRGGAWVGASTEVLRSGAAMGSKGASTRAGGYADANNSDSGVVSLYGGNFTFSLAAANGSPSGMYTLSATDDNGAKPKAKKKRRRPRRAKKKTAAAAPVEDAAPAPDPFAY